MIGAKTFIHFPNCHRFKSLPQTSNILRISNMSLSVGTVHQHKNVPKMFKWAHLRQLQHTHVGSHGDEPSVAWTEGKYVGAQPDEIIDELLARASYFFCLSRDEGFSMTPMEAILAGIPHVLLSDIPVHREIYGGVGVTFDKGDPSSTKFRRISKAEREALFAKYAPENTMRDLLSHLGQ